MKHHPQDGASALKPEDFLGPLNAVESKFAPRQIFFAGDCDLFQAGPRVSLVGSRRASAQGLQDARRLAQALVENGAVIVSGLAEGIDTAAHLAAMEADGKTIAVLGTPLEKCYPRVNQPLQERIMLEHLALSQFPPGMPVQKGNFPMRNRTMALMSNATVIVEAAEGSGSLHQGWEALRLGRALFFAERMARDPSLSWPAKFVEYGAIPLNMGQIEDLLYVLPSSGARLHFDAAI